MAVTDKHTRRTDEAERLHHIAAGEAAAFATTAGAMLLGVLATADAAQLRSEHQPPPAIEPAPPPPHSHQIDVAPTEPAPADVEPGHEDQHAGAMQAPMQDVASPIHADVMGGASAPIETASADGAASAHFQVSSIPVWDFSADQVLAAADGAPSSPDPAASIHPLVDTIAGLVDTPLAVLSHTVASLSATVGQLTSTLSDSISHLTDELTGAFTGVAHGASVAGGIGTPLADALGSATQTPDLSGVPQHVTPLVDTAGTVPTAFLHPLPLHLGFLGQPTIDGHDVHDGAFSALGIHHF